MKEPDTAYSNSLPGTDYFFPTRKHFNNCLSVKLESASKQELEIAFVYNPNDEAEKINNLSEALNQLASNGCKNQLLIGDYNTSLNTELDYVDYAQDPHKASREFLHGLQAARPKHATARPLVGAHCKLPGSPSA